MLSYDDVLISPGYSEIEHRTEISLSQNFLGREYTLPIISANMASVTGGAMGYAMIQAGGFYVLHRFHDTNFDFNSDVNMATNSSGITSISVGIREPEKSIEIVERFLDPELVVTVDTAHGFHKRVGDMVKRLKDIGVRYVIAGNVATTDGYEFLADSGADAVKIGIGPGAACTTRETTGIGIPQFSAIREIYNNRTSKIPIIADGGIKNSGDVVKALAAGAEMVMLGSLLAGTDESPGERRTDVHGKTWVQYDGSSIFGSNRDLYTVEGVAGWVPSRGPVAGVLKELRGGIISGMSYVGARNIIELREKAKFVRITSGSSLENGTRIQL